MYDMKGGADYNTVILWVGEAGVCYFGIWSLFRGCLG